MDSAITFTVGIAGVLTGLLGLDLVLAAVRQRHALRERLDRPLRFVLGSTLVAALVLGAARPAPAVTPPPTVRILDAPSGPPAVSPLPVPPGPAVYVVERGDSLWRIARAVLVERGLPSTGRDVARFWPQVYDANRGTIGSDPNLIHPGQRLAIPTPAVSHGA